MTHDELLEVIQKRMRTLDVGPRQLAAKLRGRVSQATVYNFVVGGKPAKTNTLVEVLTELGLLIVEKGGRR